MAENRLEEIRQLRLAKREALLSRGAVPYPSEVRRSHTLEEVTAGFEDFKTKQLPLTVVGRILNFRRHGALTFIDLQDGTGKLQLQLSVESLGEEGYGRLSDLDAGDFLEVAGQAIVTQRGVPSLLVEEFHVVSKSIRPLPSTWYGLKDHEARFRQRELDLLLNPATADVIRQRRDIIAFMRAYLTERQFMEVETPILQAVAGGATAAPFATHHNALDSTLYLRIAPELYLKRLLVAGFEKVFELGRNFRNEGIDRDHNPEFTMLEFYWAYADYEDMMDFTEQFLTDLVRTIKGSEEITRGETTLSVATPWKRQRYVDAVGEIVGFDILHDKNPAAYLAIFTERGLPVPEVATYPKLVDELYKTLVRPHLLQPTILYDYPVELAPLAKRNVSDPRIAEKFQVVMGGTELVNAYTELNDPVEQRQRFAEQAKNKAQGDNEAHPIDEEYLRAMEYGMPPAAGFGLGVDRLVALLTNSATLRETITFPLLRPE